MSKPLANTVAEVLGVHRYLIGGGRDSHPDHCSCGQWDAVTLNDAEVNDRDWRQHVGSMVERDLYGSDRTSVIDAHPDTMIGRRRPRI